MEIVQRTIGDLTILDMKGRLVAGDGDEMFRDTVDRLVQLGRRQVLVNLDGVPYIDSGGLGVLVSKYITVRNRNGHLKLCNPRARCFKVLEMTKLLTVFDTFDSEADAINSFTE